MPFLKDADKEHVKQHFENLDGKVKLIVFTQEMECMYCQETRELMEEVASLSDKIDVEVYDFVQDKQKVEEYKIDKIPAVVVEGEKDYGVRFYGIPMGYEFMSLVEAISTVSTEESNLSQNTQKELQKLKRPVHIQVFVTLTCPYCSQAVSLAHKLAIESDLITADMVESAEFPHLTQKYRVMAVPKIILNEEIQFEGALPETLFVENVMKTQTT
ncbi:TPA: glutaredoxin [Candidatus Poribacteria bacterium]|nr:glutaredoxin [Candidatus Poribacteria bacterium]